MTIEAWVDVTSDEVLQIMENQIRAVVRTSKKDWEDSITCDDALGMGTVYELENVANALRAELQHRVEARIVQPSGNEDLL